MSDLGLILERKDELIDAISRLTERSTLYQRKLDTHSQSQEFGAANRKYELQRKQFYRDLSGDEKEEIESFCITM